jgi:hypothetical protein
MEVYWHGGEPPDVNQFTEIPAIFGDMWREAEGGGIVSVLPHRVHMETSLAG